MMFLVSYKILGWIPSRRLNCKH